VKTFNSSRLPWEEATAPKGAAAHSLGTTDLKDRMSLSKQEMILIGRNWRWYLLHVVNVLSLLITAKYHQNVFAFLPDDLSSRGVIRPWNFCMNVRCRGYRSALVEESWHGRILARQGRDHLCSVYWLI